MSKKSTYLLCILLTIIIGCFLSWWFCCNPSVIDGNSTDLKSQDTTEINATNSLKEATKTPFTISDSETGFSVSSDNNFNFNQSNASILTPVSDEIDTIIDKLKTYLLENPNKTLDIVGHYKSDEKEAANFESLGFARADAIKQYLISQGIPEAKITTKSNLNDTMKADANSVLFGPVTFNLLGESSEGTNTEKLNPTANAEEETKAKMNALKNSILSNPLEPDFKHSEFNFKISNSQRKKITAIVKYLKNVEDSSLSIIGHTDSSASSRTNYKLGQKRADFVKNILIKNGAPAKKIKTFSKGEDSPIASNATEAGKKKNRRVEYKLN